MKLGILKTGQPPAEIGGFGDYPAMFRRLLGETTWDYEDYDVAGGQLPDAAGECFAYLITGSACDAYSDLPWIVDLRRFLLAAKGKAAFVGICFGHQVMAQAFGGTVIKSPKGWGIGAMTYDVHLPQPWLEGEACFTLPAIHQDQVVEQPPASQVVAGSPFAPYGMLAYTDQPAISLQLHPEFEPAYLKALIRRMQDRGSLSSAQAHSATTALDGALDRDRAARWINAFLRSVSAPQ